VPYRKMASKSTLAIVSRSGVSRRDRWACYSPDVMDGILSYFLLDDGGASEIR
jgi:hypothetical protein